jgi:para-nitrobenzyl esterase
MMIGTARDTLNMIISTRPWVGHLDEPGLRALAVNHVGEELADDVIAAERLAKPNWSPTRLGLSIINHRTLWRNAVWMAEKRAAHAKAPTFMYRFDYATNAFDGLWGAYHGGEFGFFFNNADKGIGSFSGLFNDRDDRYEVQKTLNESFVKFALTGDPSSDRIGKWRAFSNERRATMLLDSECRLENDPESEIRQIYEKAVHPGSPADYERALLLSGFAK